MLDDLCVQYCSTEDADHCEGRKSDINYDSEDGDDNGDPSDAGVEVTTHVVCGGGPSSFMISVSTAPSTRV